ncbi:hypothetical protein [Candidatus Protochlamydia naegleriophila]|uniref:hypothetical protein n=1 Tax=Candidatus Protochlamydia naegleriophila TaxID=389348 RepID=UPI00130108A9|nr:hypothetical protein [Candidatus Protochlamydia naegleriophila]
MRVADDRFIVKNRINPLQIEPTPTLIPTGALRLLTFLVPMSGELESGITKDSGINFGSLSGVGIAQMQVASYYAYNESFQFDPEKEMKLILDYDPTARPHPIRREYYSTNRAFR